MGKEQPEFIENAWVKETVSLPWLEFSGSSEEYIGMIFPWDFSFKFYKF